MQEIAVFVFFGEVLVDDATGCDEPTEVVHMEHGLAYPESVFFFQIEEKDKEEKERDKKGDRKKHCCFGYIWVEVSFSGMFRKSFFSGMFRKSSFSGMFRIFL
jgi:hypothetical protein